MNSLSAGERAAMRLGMTGQLLLVSCGLCVASLFADESTSQATAEDLDAAPRLMLTQAGQFHLINDAAAKLALRDARNHLEAGRHVEGLSLLQQILDRGDDRFVRSRTDAEFASLRLDTMNLIRDLPPVGQATYERLFGTQARQLWESDRESGRSRVAAEVLRRFFHTAAGYDAAAWLAKRSLDRGEWHLAARLFERILAEPVHQPRVTNTLRIQAALALRQIEREARSTELLDSIREGTVAFAGSPGLSGRLAAESLRSSWPKPSTRQSSDWRVPAGADERQVAMTGTAPWLKPMWSVELLSHPGEKEVMRLWLNEQLSNVPQRVAAVAEPLVVGDQVIFRESNGLRSVHVVTGQTLWRTRASWPLIELQSAYREGGGSIDDPTAMKWSSVGNSAWGHLSSDGEMVFAVDFAPVPEPDPATDAINRDEDTERDSVRAVTRLIAVPLARGSQIGAGGSRDPAWVLDGQKAAGKMGRPGSTIHFHGPPAILDGSLFVIGESFSLQAFDRQKDSQLNLLAVSAATGELMWWQGLALVNLPYFHRDQVWRHYSVGTPTVARGMLICPTDTGLTFGVDLITGRQRWVFDEQHGLPGNGPGRFVRGIREERQLLGWPGLTSWPVIHRDRVLLLPRFSDFVHCLDLLSGRLLWRCPRGDALFIGAVTDESVLLIGDHEVRAIPLNLEGHNAMIAPRALWSQRLGIVTGRGVHVGTNYLLPLKSGRIACLDLATGREQGHSLRTTRAARTDESDWGESSSRDPVDWPGNLVVAGDTVLSMGPTRITAYPQAAAALAESQRQPKSIEQQLHAVELGMLLQSESNPLPALQALVRETLSPQQTVAAESLLRESLSLELNRRPQDADALLAEWRRVARTPEDRAVLLRRTSEVFASHDPLRTMQAVRELTSLPLEREIDVGDTGLHVVAPESWAFGILQQVRDRARPSPELAERLTQEVRSARDKLLKSDDLGQLRRFVRVYGEWPEASAVRMRLSELLVERGEFQESEFLLTRDRTGSDPVAAGTATARLAQMYDRLGLHRAAANLLEELQERSGNEPFLEPAANGAEMLVTGREFVSRFGGSELTQAALARRHAPTWPIQRVLISEDRNWTTSATLLEAFGQPGDTVQRPRTPSAMSFDLVGLDSRGLLRSEDNWQVIDKESGVVTGQLQNMNRFFQPGFGGSGQGLHFVPLANSGQFRGASLLEQDPAARVWNYVFADQSDAIRSEYPRVGPFGPEFCSFQSQQHLVVLNPANGQLLWRRGPLEPQSGLHAEHESGLFGDRNILVMFHQDFVTYTVYETLTGRELRRGKLDVDMQVPRRAVGRRLLYQSLIDNQRRVRLWDPLTNQFDLDEPVGRTVSAQPLSFVMEDGALLLVLPTGRIRLIDVEKREIRLDVTLPANQVMGANTARVVADRDRVYINLRRGMVDSQRRFFSAHLTETPLPRLDVEGELYAFARPNKPQPLGAAPAGPGGRLLWNRVLSPRSILRLDQENPRWPFLVLLCQRRERQGNSPLSLHVEAVDAATGVTLGERGRLQLDRPVQTRLDPQAGRLSLLGVNTRINLDFSPERQQLDRSDEPH